MEIVAFESTSINKKVIENIFFENSSKQSFINNQEKIDFLNRWLTPYLANWPDNFFVSESDDLQIQGYLAGCSNSTDALAEISHSNSSYSIFQHLFNNYPAHLHINISKKFQGIGVGKKLVSFYEEHLKNNNIQGLHAITSAGESNINFYKKLNFEIIETKKLNSWELVFLGKKLTF